MSPGSPGLKAMPPPRFVTRGAFRIAYSAFGDPADTPLVICHGLAAEGEQFRDDAAFFAEHGFFVIVPDLRGHGQSISPDARRDSDFTIAELAGDLVAMLDAEGITATHWVGNSLGGILALKIIADTPERLLSLVTFGTAQTLDVPRWLPVLSDLAQRVAGKTLSAKATALMTSWHPPARRLIETILRRIDRDAVMRVTRNLVCYDLRAAARRYHGPMLMLRGDRDKAVNAALAPTLANMEGVDGFRLVEIAGAGHCANLDRPEAVRAEILGFLRKAAAEMQPLAGRDKAC